MSRRRRSLAPRDQAASPFSGILMALCDASGALGAALVDREGESVDYAGYIHPFDLKVAAAEWRIVLDVARSVRHQKDTHGIVVRGSRKSFVVAGLPDGYALVLELPRRSFDISRRALAEGVRAVVLEAALAGRASTPVPERWVRVEVRPTATDRRRPEAVWLGGAWHPVVILGRHQRLPGAPREVAFRARLPNGLEFTLVREPPGVWFADAL